MQNDEEKDANSVLINFILNNRLDHPDVIIPTDIECAIEKCECSVSTKKNCIRF